MLICEKDGHCVDCPINGDDEPCDHVIEVEKVIHGRWHWETSDIYRCSNCGCRVHVEEVLHRPAYKFCPYCGARNGEDE